MIAPTTEQTATTPCINTCGCGRSGRDSMNDGCDEYQVAKLQDKDWCGKYNPKFGESGYPFQSEKMCCACEKGGRIAGKVQ